MPSTSVHFPDFLIEELDRFATERGVSRNRLIVEACRATLRQHQEWPEDFFDDSRFLPRDLEDLRRSAADFDEKLVQSRRDRDAPPF